MPDRFILLRGTPDGPVYLARPDHYDDTDSWTGERDEARGFGDRAEADAIREEIMGRGAFAVAVVPGGEA